MPKHLFLCRHAHTQEALYNQKDYDRQLSPTGLTEASATGSYIQAFGLNPDLIICSAAVRTRQTAALIAEKLHFDISKIKALPELYNAPTPKLTKLIQDFSPTMEVAIVVGHNPAVSEFMNGLSPNQSGQVPTGGCCYVSFNEPEWEAIAWADIKIKLNF